MSKKTALIMVDLQNDFCPGGKLAVPEGDRVVTLANRLQKYFDLIIATKDWHPADHMSFAKNHPNASVGDVIVVEQIPQVLWPEHCVQHSQGALFHPSLNVEKINNIFHKGIDKTIDSYSAFFDNAHKRSTGLGDFLCAEQVETVYILGLATDYCVKYSALDALHLGLNVVVIIDACRGVELKPGDTERAIQEMVLAGAKIIHTKDILDNLSDTQVA